MHHEPPLPAAVCRRNPVSSAGGRSRGACSGGRCRAAGRRRSGAGRWHQSRKALPPHAPSRRPLVRIFKISSTEEISRAQSFRQRPAKISVQPEDCIHVQRVRGDQQLLPRICPVRLQPRNNRGGTTLRERLVVLAVSLIVSVSRDDPTRAWMVVNQSKHGLERRLAIRSERGGIGVEVNSVKSSRSGLRDRLLEGRRAFFMTVQLYFGVSALPGHDVCCCRIGIVARCYRRGHHQPRRPHLPRRRHRPH